MNKAELVDAIAAATKLTKVDSLKALNAFITATSSTLKKGKAVALVGWGRLVVHKYKKRNYKLPSGKVVTKQVGKSVFFRASSDLKKAANK